MLTFLFLRASCCFCLDAQVGSFSSPPHPSPVCKAGLPCQVRSPLQTLRSLVCSWCSRKSISAGSPTVSKMGRSWRCWKGHGWFTGCFHHKLQVLLLAFFLKIKFIKDLQMCWSMLNYVLKLSVNCVNVHSCVCTLEIAILRKITNFLSVNLSSPPPLCAKERSETAPFLSEINILLGPIMQVVLLLSHQMAFLLLLSLSL